MNFKKSQAGFTPIHLLLILVLIGIIGFTGWKVYNVSKTVNQPEAANAPEPNAKKDEPVIPEGFTEYENKELNFKFAYPSDWKLEISTYGEPLTVNRISVSSTDLKEEEWEIGATNVIKGAKISFYVGDSQGKTLDQFFNSGLKKSAIDRGDLKPTAIKVNGNEALEYSFQYEGPESRIVELLLKPNMHMSAHLETEGDEVSHPTYVTFKKILNTVNSMSNN